MLSPKIHAPQGFLRVLSWRSFSGVLGVLLGDLLPVYREQRLGQRDQRAVLTMATSDQASVD
jgi:hypothetical protein